MHMFQNFLSLLMQNEDVRTRFAAFPSLASLEATPRSIGGDVLLLDRRRDLQLLRLAQLVDHVLHITKKESTSREMELQRLAEIVRLVHMLKKRFVDRVRVCVVNSAAANVVKALCNYAVKLLTRILVCAGCRFLWGCHV
jgi:hypothetical protein